MNEFTHNNPNLKGSDRKKMDWKSAASTAVIVVIALVIVLRLLVIRIEPGEAGVLNRPWTSGLAEEDFGPGYHFDVGPFHDWTVFDTTVQTLHMKDRSAAEIGRDVVGPLQVKSSEGATVTLDLSIKYRIKPGQAWNILNRFGSDQTQGGGYKRRFADEARNVLVATLGSIDTEEFYDPAKRTATRDLMEAKLREKAEENDIELIAILIRDMRFDPLFEQRIAEQALAEEKAALNIEETAAEEAKGETDRILSQTLARVVVIDEQREKEITVLRAENDRKVEAIRANTQKRVTEIRSDADLFAAQQKAEGDLLVRKATADGEQLRSTALRGDGGANVVAMRLAESLNLGELTISTQAVNPFDVQSILDLLGARSTEADGRD